MELRGFPETCETVVSGMELRGFPETCETVVSGIERSVFPETGMEWSEAEFNKRVVCLFPPIRCTKGGAEYLINTDFVSGLMHSFLEFREIRYAQFPKQTQLRKFREIRVAPFPKQTQTQTQLRKFREIRVAPFPKQTQTQTQTQLKLNSESFGKSA